MLASALIVFREVFEAGLILGIVLSATRGVAGRAGWAVGGVVGGLLGACLVAVFAGAIGDAMQGSGQEVFNAGILFIAAAMLGWHNVWMARHGREMAGEMKALGRGVTDGSRTLLALAIVIGVAILREGAEVVLFMYGLVIGGDGALVLISGSVLGLLGGSAVAALLYRGLVAIPTRQLFRVTNIMLSLLAAGMAAQAAGFLVRADLLPAWGAQIWNTSDMLDEKSILGRALHALIGYTDRPTGMQLAVYAVTLAALLIAGRATAPRSPVKIASPDMGTGRFAPVRAQERV